LSYIMGIVGVGYDGKGRGGIMAVSVEDVTRRYTREWGKEGLRCRRRAVCSSGEVMSESIIANFNRQTVQSILTPTSPHIIELNRRIDLERSYLQLTETAGPWGEGNNDDYHLGRLSGSLAWRIARGEISSSGKEGQEKNEDEEEKDERETVLHPVETFLTTPPSYPTRTIRITLPPSSTSSTPPTLPKSYPSCVTIDNVPCGAGLPSSISLVVIDECYPCCVLGCRVFRGWVGVDRFLETLPVGRIVAICATVGAGLLEGKGEVKGLERVSGLNIDMISKSSKNDGSLMCVGQMNRSAEWATCISTTATMDESSSDEKDSGLGKMVEVEITIPNKSESKHDLRLRGEVGFVPRTVCMRLPDVYMTLEKQKASSADEKREGFIKLCTAAEGGKGVGGGYVGYCTKEGAPVYLIKNTAFPLRRFAIGGGVGIGKNTGGGGNSSKCWTTYHFLPEPLVPDDNDDDCGKTTVQQVSSSPKLAFSIPVNEEFFESLLGPTLLQNSPATSTINNPPNNGNSLLTVPTTTTLIHNESRLVALYFSAHWCPPCRKFTPVLIEFYNILKERLQQPQSSGGGLEIVFISSDRDILSFQNYFQSMPWLAVPLDMDRRREIGSRFGIQGIPALIVLDAISGEVVVTMEDSRREVMTACRGGDVAIEKMLVEDWFQRIPPESQMLMETLALSCKENEEKEKKTKLLPPKSSPAPYNPYLQRSPPPTTNITTKTYKSQLNNCDPSERIKEVFHQIIKKDPNLSPNIAAARAIEQVTQERQKPQTEIPPQQPKLDHKKSCVLGNVRISSLSSSSDYHQKSLSPLSLEYSNHTMFATAKKYLTNVIQKPHIPRYRTFRASNKIFDSGITSSTDGIEQVVVVVEEGEGQLQARLGLFDMYWTDVDLMVCIPLGSDLDGMEDYIGQILLPSEAEK